MNTSRARGIASCLTVLALITAGCSAGGGEDTKRVSINSILGIDEGDWSAESQRAQEDQIQEYIARCMAEQGWDYIPVKYPDTFYEYSEEDEAERIAREGYGYAYWTLNQGNDNLGPDPFQDFVDPNQAYIESLSDSEQTAYFEALYGTQEENDAQIEIEIDPETGEEHYISYGNGSGCQGEAYDEVYGDNQGFDEDYYMALEQFYTELWERVEADPRIAKLNTDWLSCMKKAGFDFKARNELWEGAHTDFQERHDEIVGPDLYSDPFEGWSDAEIDDFFTNSSQAEIDALFNTRFELTDDQRAALEALLADEIELGLADLECSKGFSEKEADIYAEIEERFAEEHRAELEQIAATFGTDK